MTLPTFLVIGYGLAGTTSLYNYLGQHPEIYMSPIKETNFWAYLGEGMRDDELDRTGESIVFPGQSLFRARHERAVQCLLSSDQPAGSDRLQEETDADKGQKGDSASHSGSARSNHRVRTGGSTGYAPLSPDTRRMLAARYEPDVGELAQLIDRDLSGWLA